MLHHLGIAGGAGAEEDQHGIRALQVFRTGKDRREVAVHGIVIHPAVPFAVDGEFPLERGSLVCHRIDRIADAVTGSTDHALDFGFVDAVFDVMAQQLNRCGDDNGTQFVQGVHQIPELVVTTDDQHDAVALPDAEGIEEIGRPGGVFRDVAESEVPADFLIGDPAHSQFFRFAGSNAVQHVKRKVEVFRNIEIDFREGAIRSPRFRHIFLIEQLGVVHGGRFLFFGQIRCEAVGCHIFHILVHHNGEEFAGSAAHRCEGMGVTAVKVHGVTHIECFQFVLEHDPEGAFEDEDEFLSGVGRKFHFRIFAAVGSCDDERFPFTILHVDRLMQIGEAGATRQREAFTVAGNGVKAQVGRNAADNGGEVNTETFCHPVIKGEGSFFRTGFVAFVFFGTDAES